ncbi:MAG: kelch repeat-containing protein [Elusimicrobiaceae bacterium]
MIKNAIKTLTAAALLCAAFINFAGPVQAALNTRQDHSTTLLQNGNFLILGGTNNGAYVQTVQIYNVATSAMTDVLTSALAARSFHTATTIPDGRVVIAGGENQTSSLAYFDPADNSLTAFASALGGATRKYHTATLLRSGKILLAGGMDSSDVTATTGLLITVSGNTATVSPTGSMITPRYGHTATLLPNGKVFVSGGIYKAATGTPRYIENTEIYDPASNTWSPGPALIRHRAFHTATALNSGFVMISGGKDNNNRVDPYISMLGSQGYVDEVEKYDPYSNSIIPAPKLPVRLSSHTMTLDPSGELQMMGGYGNFDDQHIDGPFSILESTVVFTAIAGSTATANVTLAQSALTLTMDATFSEPYNMSGTFVDAFVIFDSATVISPSFDLHVNYASPYKSYSDISGKNIYSGRLRGEFPLTFASGNVTFMPKTITGDGGETCTLTIAGTIAGGGQGKTVAGDICNVTAKMTLPLSEFITSPMPKSKVITAYGTVEAMSLSDGENYQAEYKTGMGGGPATNLPAAFSDPSLAYPDPEASLTFRLTMGAGDFYNSTTTAISGTKAMTVQSVSLKTEYVASPVSVRGLSYDTVTSTCAVRTFISADNIIYNPKNTAWTIRTSESSAWQAWNGKVVVHPYYRHSTVLTPASDIYTTGGADCSRVGRTIPPTSSSWEDWATCTSTVTQSISRVLMEYVHDWTQGPALLQNRGQHTANLLPNGKIMVSGGTNGSVTLNTAEIMDPRNLGSASWQSASTMKQSRANHTANMLPNGNILLAGGYMQEKTTGTLSGAEIYYPEDNAWVPTTAMWHARQGHTAVMIPKGAWGGHILVIGGYSSSTYQNSMEAYDPVNAQWTELSATLTNARAQHTATILHNGNILVCGGLNGTGGTLSSCEMITVGTGVTPTFTVSAAPSLSHPRHSHTATLLRDGRVLIVGGNDGASEIKWRDGNPTSEISVMNAAGNVASWSIGTPNPGGEIATGQELIIGRQNHTTSLLPNGKILVFGGVTGLRQTIPEEENFNTDFSTWSYHKNSDTSGNRGYHTTVITSSGIIVSIGGYDGNAYTNTTVYRYFMATPDSNDPNASAATGFSVRQPSSVSINNELISQISTVTLMSGASNFFGLSEASGGGTGGQNSYHAHPRVYVYMMDNPSGFMLDLSTRPFADTSMGNTNWDQVRSSITFTTPQLPYGWYQFRAANTALYSNGVTAFVSKPKPTGTVNSLTAPAKSTDTITWYWDWTLGAFANTEGFTVRASSNNVFIATVAYDAAATNTGFVQTSLEPNTEISVKVGPYNLSGTGSLVNSATYYTYANVPAALAIASATFSSASLEWNQNHNSAKTIYEVSMARENSFSSNVSTPIPFSMGLSTNNIVITNLNPGSNYYFRVRAQNGAGETTDFCCKDGSGIYPSTRTISSPTGLEGVANGTTTLRWSWQPATSATYYEIYATTAEVRIGTTTQISHVAPSFITVGLSTNTAYSVKVRAVNNDTMSTIYSAFTMSPTVYTLTDEPARYGSSDQSIIITKDQLDTFWIGQTNPTGTQYNVQIATSSDFTTVLQTQSVTQLAASAYMTAQFAGLTPNTPYYVRVQSVNGDGVQGGYVLISTAPKYTSPSAPANFQPSNITSSGLTLTWDANGNPSDTKYQITYSTWASNPNPASYIAFADNHTSTTTAVTGLWTKTTYYFFIGAKNNAPVEDDKNYSATISMSPQYILTLAGPTGTSSGSISGIASQGVISGKLPTGRDITITIPASSFTNGATEISLAELGNQALCPGGIPIVFEMLTTGEAQPRTPVTFEFSYDSTELASRDKSKLVLARYNTVTRECLPLQTTVYQGSSRKIVTELNHFSKFQVVEVTAPTNLNSVFIYPNPFYPNRGDGFVTFNNLPQSTSLRVYTLTGEKVWEGSKNAAGPIVWDGRNSSGEPAASGIYLIVIDGAGEKKIYKVAIER